MRRAFERQDSANGPTTGCPGAEGALYRAPLNVNALPITAAAGSVRFGLQIAGSSALRTLLCRRSAPTRVPADDLGSRGDLGPMTMLKACGGCHCRDLLGSMPFTAIVVCTTCDTDKLP